MSKLILFTTCGDVKHGHDYFQVNAFNSWKRLIDKTDFFHQVVVFADEGTNHVKKLCEERNFIYDTDFERTPFGMPYVDSLFKEIRKYVHEDDLVCSLTSDCMLFEDFIKTCEIIKKEKKDSLLIAQKFDWMMPNFVNFDKIDYFLNDKDEVTSKLYWMYKDQGKFHHPMGVDLYVCNRDLYNIEDFPKFSIARGRFDHWMCGFAMEKTNISVIDITKTCFLLHQEHNRIKGDLRAQGLHDLADQVQENERIFLRNQLHGQVDMATFYTEYTDDGEIVIKKRKKEDIPFNHFGRRNYYDGE